LNELHIDSCNI